jgi:hypothetical protein
MIHCPTLLILLALAQAPDISPGRSYKVAFWYDLDRPFSSARFRAYDVAKGEYDPAAVEAWQRTIQTGYPGTGNVVRDLSTVGEPGATETERLIQAIEREKRRWAGLNDRPSSRPLVGPVVRPIPTRSRDDAVGRVGFDRPSPGSPGPVGNLPASPYPYPYRSGPR